MEAVRVFRHSVYQVFGNFGAALRISALPVLLQGLLLLVVLPRALPVLLGEQAGPPAFGPLLIAFVAVAIPLTLAFLVIAVNWHRVILLNEAPRLVPKLHRKQMIAYASRFMLILVVLVAAIIPVWLILGFVSRTSGSFILTYAVAIVFNIAITALLTALSISLPAMTVDKPMSLGDGWKIMRRRFDVVIVLAIITALAQHIVGRVMGIFAISPFSALALQLVGGWIMMMVGLSILTTLYGHYVEGRPLR